MYPALSITQHAFLCKTHLSRGMRETGIVDSSWSECITLCSMTCPHLSREIPNEDPDEDRRPSFFYPGFSTWQFYDFN